ncbi:MAG: hypothetical protein JSS10_06355 [Verrucomicrobia bacterium]|nr:hypothetical protein [Verrucomicrobiota bacterium]
MKKYLTLIFLFLAIQGWAKQSYDTLFILQDAGETNALLPVIEKCAQNNENFLILTGGQATETLSSKMALKDKTLSFAQLGISEQIDKSWKRDDKISDASLKKIETEIEPKQVISGVAFELHGQLLEAFKTSKSITFAYWDNINYEGTDPYFKTAQKVAKVADHLLVPSKAFQNAYPQSEVVGQPSYELWKKQLSGIQPSSVAAKLPFAIKSPSIVFIGGYGHDYDEALRLFLNMARELKGYTILMTYHPKLEGKVEKEELKKYELPYVHLLESKLITTMEAIAIADHVICHLSTVGIQAAIAGKDVIYLLPPGQTYTNLLIERGGAQVVSTLPELMTSLTNKRSADKDPFMTLKVPQGSVDLIYNRIHSSAEKR